MYIQSIVLSSNELLHYNNNLLHQYLCWAYLINIKLKYFYWLCISGTVWKHPHTEQNSEYLFQKDSLPGKIYTLQ